MTCIVLLLLIFIVSHLFGRIQMWIFLRFVAFLHYFGYCFYGMMFYVYAPSSFQPFKIYW